VAPGGLTPAPGAGEDLRVSPDRPPSGNRFWTGAEAAFRPDRPAREGPPIGKRIWRRVVLGMHAAFVVLAALAAANVLTTHEPERWARPGALGAIGAIAVGYAVAGRVGLATADRSRRAKLMTTAYLVVVVLGTGLLARTSPGSLFIYFIVYPQVWVLVDRRRPAIVWTLLVLVASLSGLLLHQARTHDAVVAAIGNQLVGALFSLLLGLWVHMLFHRTLEQARLIDELERAKAEVAALERERGALAERERMARDVHDTLAQGYTSILMLARTALAQLRVDPAAARERLELVEEVAQENLAQARALVASQAPVELDGTSLPDALAQLARRFTRETGIDVDVRFVTGDPVGDVPAATQAVAVAGSGLRPAEELVLLRAAQEALTNARRHASPSRVSLTLHVARPGAATVRVVDDGVGFAAGAEPGSGLTGLRGRVEEAGGELSVISAPGAGTSLEARIGPAAGYLGLDRSGTGQ
jgi:signal transduction histidine kinase